MNSETLPPDLVAAGFRLDGRVAVVTGAGSIGPGFGIGRASAILLAEAGARVVIVDNDLAAAEETVALIEQRGGTSLPFELDVTDESEIAAAFALVEKKWGAVHALVNNVGIVGPPGTVENLDLARWEEAMRVNVTSMVMTSRAAIPSMRLAGGGSIINISSVAGISSGYPAALYPTSKGAVISLTRAMAAHHGQDRIRVNAIAPGALFTPRIAVRKPSEKLRENRAKLNLLGVEGNGWDAAYAVLYLAGDASRWVTGSVLTVDAGVSTLVAAGSPPSK